MNKQSPIEQIQKTSLFTNQTHVSQANNWEENNQGRIRQIE